MATPDATKTEVAVTGSAYVATVGTTAPTGTASALTAFTHVGYLVRDDGISITKPSNAGDKNNIRALQNGAVVRTIYTPTDDLPTAAFTMLETNPTSVGVWADAVVTTASTEGSYSINPNGAATHYALVIDIVDGSELTRHFFPNAVVTESGDITYLNDDAVSYPVTFEGSKDATAGYAHKAWSTRLKTPA